jgi:hypothetical protein
MLCPALGSAAPSSIRVIKSARVQRLWGEAGKALASPMAGGIEALVIHAASVAVSRAHRRAKTDRLDTESLKRAFLGWLRGEKERCKMAGIPTLAEEDAKRPHLKRESLVGEQIMIISRMKATQKRPRYPQFQSQAQEGARAARTRAQACIGTSRQADDGWFRITSTLDRPWASLRGGRVPSIAAPRTLVL